jgi:sucrose-6-phosphate hydrolase SacC (GH32 family)
MATARISNVVLLAILFLNAGAHAQQPDIVYADFEGDTYGDWTTTGTAFGDGPAAGTLPNQMEVSGFKGKRLVNSFHGGDNATGTLTSPSFKIERKYISFLIGGGGFEGKTCMNLLVGGKVVRTAAGQNTKPGGHELLEESRWDVTNLAGQSASLQIVDNATGGWGHILVDQIVFTDTKPPAFLNHPGREIVAERKFLNFPVRNGASVCKMKLIVDGQPVREFTIECADGEPDWWAAADISAWRGKTLKIEVDKLSEDSKFLPSIEQDDSRRGMENLYGEAVRPQLHFSPSRGWNNDPNGLCFFNGEYHLFFQLNPYGVKWGNMHWGHAVSTDLMHWKELDIALYPDALGPMFSGSAVVDWKNTSGLGSEGKPPLVLIYTAAGSPSVQCLAYSTDGRQFTKLPENPIVKHISGGNRDPKVIWHEPTHQWVMALYVDFPEPVKGGAKKGGRQTIHFLTSPNLKEWTVAGQIEGFYECPDLFALPVDGDAKNTKWVLTAASSDYMVGEFDGKTFVPAGPKLKGHRGRGFYAAQTFSDLPASDGRRIQVGWLQTPSPKMPFNQSMSVPLELKLLSTSEGPRLAWSPVKELETLRAASKKMGASDLKPEASVVTEAGELLDVRLEFEPGQASEVQLDVRGVAIRYDVQKQELAVNNLIAPAPLRHGKQTLIVLADRNSFEIFASDGLTYVPLPIIVKDENRSVALSAKDGAAKITAFDVHQLKSIWTTP